MSAYTKIKTKLNDQESLVYSIKAMGYDPAIYEVACKLAGFSGHKNPHANIVIPRAQLQAKSAAYCDIGFQKQANGFELLVNDVDEHKMPGFLEDLNLNYNVGLAMKKAQLAGIKVTARKDSVIKGKKHVQLVFA